MKTILRRVGSLENTLGPQADLASLHLAAVRERQRKKQLEAKANGEFFEDSVHDNKPATPNRWLAIAEQLRVYQARRTGRRRAQR
jgi:hypothetical protein